jgi:anti-sigma factor RsiW
MKYKDSHLSDEQLLLHIDGEESRDDEELSQAHLHSCWKCRARRQELEDTIGSFASAYHFESSGKLPPAAGPRALLKARLAELAASGSSRRTGWFRFSHNFVLAAGLCVALCAGFFVARFGREPHNRPFRQQAAIMSIPDSTLTPGATVLVSRRMVCAQANLNNKAVPVALQRRVFEEYGISGADPRAYEVDYLVTPGLGGADDIHNLWPHSNGATVWKAEVKDALENRLREMVCDGSLDLAEAQHEIATNWISAYKKYFHTDTPLMEHPK